MERTCDKRNLAWWTNAWQFSLAVLAIIELWSCFYWSRGQHVPHKKRINLSTPGHDSNETIDLDSVVTTLLPEDLNGQSGNFLNHVFNVAFMTALVLQAVNDSWARARNASCRDQAWSRQLSNGEEQNYKGRGDKQLNSDQEDGWLQMGHLFVVFLKLFLLHMFFLPLLPRGSDRAPITTHNFLRAVGEFVSRKKSPESDVNSNYTSTAKTYSVVEAVIVKLSKYILATVPPKLDATNKAIKKHLTTRAAILALTNPILFRIRWTQFFALIRWAKFLAPLMDASNKLREHTTDFWCKWCLRQRRRRASRAWSFVIRETMGQQRREIAAKIMVENWRKQKEFKQMMQNLEDESLDRETSAVTKIQARIRAKMAEECVKVRKSERRLYGLKKVWISAEERKEARALKKEIRARLRANRKHLLRPDTEFSVRWKMVAIACVLLEVAQTILAPRISGKMEKIPLEHMLEALLYPTNESLLTSPKCLAAPHLVFSVTNMAACASAYFTLVVGALRNMWIALVQLFLHKFVIVVDIICFLDVFITFFTGELDKTTGVLVPKPFIRRWIVPGVVVQLIANPAMSGVLELVKQLTQFALEVGATRLIYVMLALLPVFEMVEDFITDMAFVLVNKANRKVVSSIFLR